jgi:hypothetical protein
LAQAGVKAGGKEGGEGHWGLGLFSIPPIIGTFEQIFQDDGVLGGIPFVDAEALRIPADSGKGPTIENVVIVL